MLGCMVGPNPGGLGRTAAGKTPGPGSVLHRGACMEFQDKVLKCVDCGTEFVFTAGEQLFFYDKQFKNEPKRCKPCKSTSDGNATRPAAIAMWTPRPGARR